MKLNHRFRLTPSINNLLINIEANKKALSLLDIPTNQIDLHRQKSFLHSGVYSARIEGNQLTPQKYGTSNNKIERLEIQNLLDTLTWLYKDKPNLSIKLVRELHARAMHNLHIDAGHFRSEITAIFDSSGNAIYLTPPPEEIVSSLTAIIDVLSRSSNNHILINIARLHYQFEKLHPFVDGNGRVGRLLTNLALFRESYSLEGTISIDQEIEGRRADYYHHLSTESSDITEFVEFFLNCLNQSQEKALLALTHNDPTSTNPTFSLPPRRAEILSVITDHTPCSFDFIRRRFMAVKSSTLHYDLQQLIKKGLVIKLGSTRAVLYAIK